MDWEWNEGLPGKGIHLGMVIRFVCGLGPVWSAGLTSYDVHLLSVCRFSI